MNEQNEKSQTRYSLVAHKKISLWNVR